VADRHVTPVPELPPDDGIHKPIIALVSQIVVTRGRCRSHSIWPATSVASACEQHWLHLLNAKELHFALSMQPPHMYF
jgi:hypothetical protein